MDPRDWLNIPKPIVHGVLILKSCTTLQSQFLETLNKNYSDFESRCNLRILNVQKAISETTDKSKESDENFKSLLKFSELRINDKTENFMKKVIEDLYILKCSSDARISELKESIQDCSKKLDLLPTHQQVKNLISTANEKEREKILLEVKESIVAPEINNLSQKIHLLHVELDSAFKSFEVQKEEEKVRGMRVFDDFIVLQNTMESFKAEQAERAKIFQNNFESILNKLQEMSGIRDELESQSKQSMNILSDYRNSHNQHIKKFENGLQNCQESINTMKQNLTQLVRKDTPVRVETPVPMPVTPPLQPLMEIPWEEINARIEGMRLDVMERISDEKKKTAELIQTRIKTIEIQGEKNRDVSNSAIQELKDKLSWLPISLSQLEGMNPGEARLFTIEARLRSEENSRIQAINHLLYLIDTLSIQKEEKSEKDSERKPKSSNIEKVLNLRSNAGRKTPQPGVSSDSYRKLDSERRNFGDGSSVAAGKFKFSTPVPEIEENGELFAAYKEKRRNGAVPKSWDVEITQIPRIQTAVLAKNSKFRPGKTNIL